MIGPGERAQDEGDAIGAEHDGDRRRSLRGREVHQWNGLHIDGAWQIAATARRCAVAIVRISEERVAYEIREGECGLFSLVCPQMACERPLQLFNTLAGYGGDGVEF